MKICRCLLFITSNTITLTLTITITLTSINKPYTERRAVHIDPYFLFENSKIKSGKILKFDWKNTIWYQCRFHFSIDFGVFVSHGETRSFVCRQSRGQKFPDHLFS